MQKVLRFTFVLITLVLPLLSWPCMVESTERNELRIERQPVVIAGERFVDNGDGTVTDTAQKLMWQKGDSGKKVTFEAAREYCRTLRLGGYADWRLPGPSERENAVAVKLRMPVHSTAALARFDLYWSSNPTILLPFNYHPAYGTRISGAYTANDGEKAFARAVRSLGSAG